MRIGARIAYSYFFVVDGAVAGFKYFEFDGAQGISIKPLYFEFSGTGSIDFLEFGLKASDNGLIKP
jgi:hypothetical protein